MPTPQPTGPRHYGFHGREKELAWLRSHFDAVAARGADGKFAGPRMAFIVAESGIGKSRLVQELYIRLTNDPQWDPPEVNYWPDAFGDGGTNLSVVPDMEGHVAKGPPRFLWLGARWSDPDERNAVQSNALPDLVSSLRRHAEIFDSYRSAWASLANRTTETVRREIGDEVAGEAVGRAMEAVATQSFLAGLVVKLGKSAVKFAKDRHEGPRSFEEIEERQERSLVDDLVDSFRLMLGSGDSVPAILWLDDAQWADAEARQFVAKLWEQATKRRWPLLIVVTHWEREWRQLARSAQKHGSEGPTMYGFVAQPGVEVEVLRHADTSALRSCVAERLPGLTPPQQSLLVEKSAGNFRQMAENLGELLSRPRNFEGGDVRAALSAGGESLVRNWKIERSERVQQRFDDLGKDVGHEVQDLLGWSSQLGSRFLRDVAVAVAQEIGGLRDARERLDQCVDPLVILGQLGVHTSEFRDRAFHAVAAAYFNQYLESDRDMLSKVLRRHLVEWINNSFDAEGNEIWPDEERGIAAPERSATGLTDEERRDLLGMALKELPLPEKPDWTKAEDVAAFRAVYLLVITEWREDLWSRVSVLVRSLEGWPFAEMPRDVLSVDNLDWMFDTAETAGAFSAAGRIAEAVLDSRRRLAEELRTPEGRRDLSVSLDSVAGIEESRGNLDAALAKYEESLEIRRALAEELGTPESLRDVSISLNNVAGIEESRGNLDAALAKYVAIHKNMRRLAEELGTPESRRDVSVSLSKVAGIDRARGDLNAAVAKYGESLEIRRALAKQVGTPMSLRDVSVSLRNVADVEEARGDLDAALAKYKESLEIRRRLAEELETPESRCHVSESLNDVAGIEQARGDLDAALTKYRESLEIGRALAEEIGTSQLRRDMSVSLISVADIEQTRGDLTAALAKYKESLEIRRAHAKQLGTPESLRDVSVSLNRVADIAHARGDFDEALAKHRESLEIRRALAESLRTPRSRRDVSVSLNRVADIERVRGDLNAALAKYEESLVIRRRLVDETANPHPQWISDLQWSLRRCCDVAIEREQFERAYELGVEVWNIARCKVGTDDSPRSREYLLARACPVLRCELELGRLAGAVESARLIAVFVESLSASIQDASVDREEQALDSATLFLCAEGMDLVSRLRGLEGNHEAQTTAAEFVSSLRASAEQLKAEEDAATDEESSQ
jgi:tetratricopeptide (TPR) repeat protein